MLSAESRRVVRDTLPVVGAAIDDITPIFYTRMFAAHPELQRDLFNRGNQARGEQQRALAGAIAAYATSQVSPGAAPTPPMITRIAHKHASLGVVTEQYSIVHEHLFAAIVEVLGAAVTAEVAAAWDELYWEFAHELVTAETALYRTAGVADGDVWRTLVVADKNTTALDTAALTLAASNGSELPDFAPGQYVSVQVQLPDGAAQIRQYSLSSAPGRGTWRITVRRIAETSDAAGTHPAGQVSNHILDAVSAGDSIRASLPFGDVTLDERSDTPLVFVSAGIGVTPMLGMLDHLAASGSTRTITVEHTDRTPARHAHRAELAELLEALPNASLRTRYSDAGDRLDLSGNRYPSDSTAYVCGPIPFMADVSHQLRGGGIPASNIHTETFGPDKSLAGI